jgi:hypothetical protein
LNLYKYTLIENFLTGRQILFFDSGNNEFLFIN